MAKKYNEGDSIIVNNADKCPMCGSDEIECDGGGYELGEHYAEMTCNNCDGRYLVWYRPVCVVIQTPGE